MYTIELCLRLGKVLIYPSSFVLYVQNISDLCYELQSQNNL